MTTTPQQPGSAPQGWPQAGPPPGYGYAQPPAPLPPRVKFGGLAWSALILGIVGVVGSPIPLLNNLTAVAAVVGIILGIIAVFGTRKVLAGIGVVLSVLAIVFTVLAQQATVKSIDKAIGTDPQASAEAAKDVTISDCKVVNEGYGLLTTQATIAIHNGTDATQSYMITVSVNDETGARVGEINAVSNSLAAGQSVTLSGMDAGGAATAGAKPGPAQCAIAKVDRFAS